MIESDLPLTPAGVSAAMSAVPPKYAAKQAAAQLAAAAQKVAAQQAAALQAAAQ